MVNLLIWSYAELLYNFSSVESLIEGGGGGGGVSITCNHKKIWWHNRIIQIQLIKIKIKNPVACRKTKRKKIEITLAFSDRLSDQGLLPLICYQVILGSPTLLWVLYPSRTSFYYWQCLRGCWRVNVFPFPFSEGSFFWIITSRVSALVKTIARALPRKKGSLAFVV